MAGAVYEVLAVALGFDVRAGGVVYLESAQVFTGGDALADALDAGVAAVADDFEHLLDLGPRVGAAEAGPGDVVEDRVRILELRPHIDQDQVAGTDGGAPGRSGLVVRIGCVGIHADD